MPGSACLPEKAGFQEFRLGLAAPPHNVRQAHRQKVGCRYSSMASLSSPPPARRVLRKVLYRSFILLSTRMLADNGGNCTVPNLAARFGTVQFPPLSASMRVDNKIKDRYSTFRSTRRAGGGEESEAIDEYRHPTFCR